MPRRPWYKWYPADYMADTMFLTLEESGAYRALLDALWIYGPLPTNPTSLAKVWAQDPRKSARLWTKLRVFFVESGETFDHPRIAAQRAEAIEKSNKARASIETRWAKQRDTNVSTNEPVRARVPDPDLKDLNPPLSPPPSKRGTRLPDDWTLPDEWRRWASAHLPDARINDEEEKFRDYWISKPGKDGVKLNRHATWRNWVRRAAESVPNGGNGAAKPMQSVWKLSDAKLLELAAERGVTTKGKSRQELIQALT